MFYVTCDCSFTCWLACFDVIPSTETVPADYVVFKFQQFAKRSLLTKNEVIDALIKVRTECNKVAQMSLFHIAMMKSMRLEEFEQTQSQTAAQVLTSAVYTFTTRGVASISFLWRYRLAGESRR